MCLIQIKRLNHCFECSYAIGLSVLDKHLQNVVIKLMNHSLNGQIFHQTENDIDHFWNKWKSLLDNNLL